MSVLSDEFEKWWKAVSNDEHVPVGIEDRHVARLAWSAAIAAAAIAADRAARAEPVYAFRRRGFNDFCTCDERRYLELSQKPGFEVAIFYTAAPAVPEDMSPANVPMYWRDESSNACAYASGFNACRRAVLAASAPSQETT